MPQLAKLNIQDSLDHFRSAHDTMAKTTNDFKPVPAEVVNLDSLNLTEELLQYQSIGTEAIRAGKVAAVILSGGQGTRLGFNGPKGMYSIGLPSNKSIFQIHVERIRKVATLAQSSGIPIYVMTSDLNHDIIQNYFAANDFFGYPAKDIIFFEQGLEPCFTFEGKIILDSDRSLALAPDGNGGIYKALKQSGSVDDMKTRGIEHLHIFGIDNVLTKSIDPIFIGACIHKQVECGNKVVWRASKSEKVGVTADFNGRMHILEYSEIPQELADSADSNGKLLFGAANICNHYLSLSFLVDKVLPNISGIYHLANKKITYWDAEQKKTITPTNPNGVKLEMFIFDVFPLAEKWTVIEVNRDDEFAPVKNEPGNSQDSPDTARMLISNQGEKWLKKVGANVTKAEETSIVEVSPLVSYAGEGLEEFSGKVVAAPCFLNK